MISHLKKRFFFLYGNKMNRLCMLKKGHIKFTHISNKTVTSKINSISKINKIILPSRWGCMVWYGIVIFLQRKYCTIKSKAAHCVYKCNDKRAKTEENKLLPFFIREDTKLTEKLFFGSLHWDCTFAFVLVSISQIQG